MDEDNPPTLISFCDKMLIIVNCGLSIHTQLFNTHKEVSGIVSGSYVIEAIRQVGRSWILDSRDAVLQDHACFFKDTIPFLFY